MEEVVCEGASRPSAPGKMEHPCLSLANKAVALPHGRTADSSGTPAQAEQWLARRDLALDGTGLGGPRGGMRDAAALMHVQVRSPVGLPCTK
ncbi:ABATE domain-containing protein [Streptomyces sp. NPDC054887]